MEWEDFLDHLLIANNFENGALGTSFWLGLKDEAAELMWAWSDATNYGWNWWDAGHPIVHHLQLPSFAHSVQ